MAYRLMTAAPGIVSPRIWFMLPFIPYGQKGQLFAFYPHPPTIGISAVEETQYFTKNVKGDLIDNPN
jgi:hypothetical protein